MPNGMDYSLKNRVIDGTGMILDTEPGTPDDVGTYVTESQLADWIKGKILFTGYYHNGNFYSDSGHTTLLAKVNGALYIDQTNANKALYVCLSLTYQSLTEEAQVQAIIDGLNDGTIVPLKAKQDQNGNVIDQTYETKADASDLKDAIDNNSQRIENLEVAVSGSLVQTNTDSTQANVKTITSANTILPWALLNRVGARAVSWNQLAINGNFATGDMTGWTDESGGTRSFADNKIIYSWNATYSNNGLSNSASLIANHTYLVVATIKNTYSESRNFRLGQSYGKQTDTFIIPSGSTAIVSGIITPTNASGNTGYMMGMFGTQLGSAYSCEMTNFMVFDLTAMNEASLTAAQFRTMFPASYYPYNTGEIIPLNPSAFKVVGKNLCEEYTSTGSYSQYSNALLTKMRMSTNTGYCLSFTVSGVSGQSRTFYLNESITAEYYYFNVTADGRYSIAFTSTSNQSALDTQATTGGAVLKNSTASLTHGVTITDVQVEKGSTATAYKSYTETTIDTSFTSDYKYVNENCYDYSENVLVNGVMRRKEHLIVGSYTFSGDENWSRNSDSWGINFYLTFSQMKSFPSGSSVNISCAIYPTVLWTTFASGVDMAISAINQQVRVNDSSMTDKTASEFAQHMAGKTIYFELASPSTPTLHDPIPNIPCEDGTTVQAVTPQTDLVNAIDVPNTIAYMTKISS